MKRCTLFILGSPAYLYQLIRLYLNNEEEHIELGLYNNVPHCFAVWEENVPGYVCNVSVT